MRVKPIIIFRFALGVALLALLVACTGASEPQAETDTGSSGTPAMVDSVSVEQRDNHYYAVVDGFYPDPCTRISSVGQTVAGATINITLATKQPEDLMCAAVLAPFSVDVLLTTGGLLPGEYTVVVNNGPSTTFQLGPAS